MLLAWIVFPLVLVALSVGCGLLLEQLAGWKLPGTLLAPAGLATIIVLTSLMTHSGATASIAIPVVVAVAVAGWAFAIPLTGRRVDSWAVGASVAVFAVSLVFVLGYLASQRRRWPRLFSLGLAVFAVLLVQMALGEVQYLTHLPWPLVLVHVGLAAAVWALLVAFVTVLWRPPAALAASRT